MLELEPAEETVMENPVVLDLTVFFKKNMINNHKL